MKHFILTIGLFLSALTQAQSRWLLFLDVPQYRLKALVPGRFPLTLGPISLFEVSESSIPAISERVHRRFGGCGGFVDVTSEVQMGRTPQAIVVEELERRSQPVTRRRYGIRGISKIKSMVDLVDMANVWDLISELSKLPDRSALTTGGADAAALIQRKLATLAARLPLSLWTVKTDSALFARQPSIVATLPGTEPSAAHIVLGAHLDTFSGDRPGADDDASGVAVILETLRAIAAHQLHFARTVDFVFYAAEEQGLLGSHQVVKSFRSAGTRVDAALQLDMIGWQSPQDTHDIYLATDYTNPDLNDALKRIIATYTKATVGETKCGYACSDHVNWFRAGVPTTFPFEASFAQRNPAMHTAEDKIEFLTVAHASLFAKVALAFVGELGRVVP